MEYVGARLHELLALDNEIGTHSYTYPDDVNLPATAELEFEFNQSQLEIGSALTISVVGAAVPRNPESITVTAELEQYHSYLSGGWSGTGGGFRSAFGYLTPDHDMIYFAPNVVFDYTLIQFWGLTAAEAEAYWLQEYADLTTHALQPLIHWPWHDYGPTIGVTGEKGYSVAMYESLLETALGAGTEFATGADVHERLETLAGASLEVSGADPIVATVAAPGGDVGRLSLQAYSDDVIERVAGWYAYDEDSVFPPQAGGTFDIWLGSTPHTVTHIVALPMRADLLSVVGDSTALEYGSEGEGEGVIELDPEHADGLQAAGADSTAHSGTVLTMTFGDAGVHTGTVGFGPTAVELTGFGVGLCGDAVLAAWTTASEIDLLGFNLYRATSCDSPWARINAEIIPSQAPGTTFGSRYSFEDVDVQPGTTYYYMLEAVHTRDRLVKYGPQSVRILRRMYLPSVQGQ